MIGFFEKYRNISKIKILVDKKITKYIRLGITV